MERKHSLSLCMIVKNEADCLARCIESLQSIPDEMIIVDTGSTDNTVEVAKKYGAIIKTYEWNNNFAQARNYALSFASKEWILVLDADEYLRPEDYNLFVSLLNAEGIDSYYIKTLNFTEPNNPASCMINLNHRLFKNHKGFHYVGAIHEQLISDEKVISKTTDLGFYHTGYLKEVVKSKNKPKRNSQILQSILDEDPNNSFHQFNLANEMFQLEKYEEAIELYNQAYEHTTVGQGYLPKLIVFRINALVANHQEKKALLAANEGIRLYPTFTHLMFVKGTIEEKLGLITKAITSYETCLTMGRPDAQLEFSKASETLWPHLKLATLYDYYGDSEKAIFHYNKYLELNPSHYQILYAVASCLRRMGLNEEQMSQQLSKYLPATTLNNKILLIDLLIKQGLFAQAQVYLNQIDLSETNSQILYLRGRNQFYLSNDEQCCEWFNKYVQYDSFEAVAPYFYLLYLLTNNEQYSPRQLQYPKYYGNLKSYLDEKGEYTLSQDEISIIFRLIEECLIIHQENLSSDLASLLEVHLDKALTLKLAQLYCKYHHNKWAKTVIENYILNGGGLDDDMINILSRIRINEVTE